MQLGKIKFILRVWSLMPKQRFFSTWGSENGIAFPHGVIKSTLWPAGKKSYLYNFTDSVVLKLYFDKLLIK